jgi:hypothetical protein
VAVDEVRICKVAQYAMPSKYGKFTEVTHLNATDGMSNMYPAASTSIVERCSGFGATLAGCLFLFQLQTGHYEAELSDRLYHCLYPVHAHLILCTRYLCIRAINNMSFPPTLARMGHGRQPTSHVRHDHMCGSTIVVTRRIRTSNPNASCVLDLPIDVQSGGG